MNAHADVPGLDDVWPVHQPAAFDAPIPGVHWYSGCDDGYPRVDPATGICESCGEHACPVCGREDCPDHLTQHQTGPGASLLEDRGTGARKDTP